MQLLSGDQKDMAIDLPGFSGFGAVVLRNEDYDVHNLLTVRGTNVLDA